MTKNKLIDLFGEEDYLELKTSSMGQIERLIDEIISKNNRLSREEILEEVYDLTDEAMCALCDLDFYCATIEGVQELNRELAENILDTRYSFSKKETQQTKPVVFVVNV